jgi:hypothetical protein
MRAALVEPSGEKVDKTTWNKDSQG